MRATKKDRERKASLKPRWRALVYRFAKLLGVTKLNHEQGEFLREATLLGYDRLSCDLLEALQPKLKKKCPTCGAWKIKGPKKGKGAA